MKNNKKGMTLVELLITIVLISIVLLFLFSLLNDLRSEKDNNDYVSENQINRADAIYTIERDLQRFPLKEINNRSGNYLIFDFIFIVKDEEKTATLSSFIENDVHYLSYINAEEEKYVWEMKDAIIDQNAKYIYKENDDSYYFMIHINIYNKINTKNNKDNNNYLDDIEISNYGKLDYLNNTIDDNDDSDDGPITPPSEERNPTCTLSMNNNGIVLNYSNNTTEYGIVKGTTKNYNGKSSYSLSLNTYIESNFGTYTGFVKNSVGESTCSIDLKKKTVSDYSFSCPTGYTEWEDKCHIDRGLANGVYPFNSSNTETGCSLYCKSIGGRTCIGYDASSQDQYEICDIEYQTPCTNRGELYNNFFCHLVSDKIQTPSSWSCPSGYTNYNDYYCAK